MLLLFFFWKTRSFFFNEKKKEICNSHRWFTFSNYARKITDYVLVHWLYIYTYLKIKRIRKNNSPGAHPLLRESAVHQRRKQGIGDEICGKCSGQAEGRDPNTYFCSEAARPALWEQMAVPRIRMLTFWLCRLGYIWLI